MKVADGFWLSKQGYNVSYTIYGFESWYDIGRTKP